MAADDVHASLTADLGGEQFKLERVDFIEELGQPFTLAVEVIVKLGEVDLLPHLGKPVGLKVHEHDQLDRAFHGLVTETEFLDESQLGYHYRLTARPFTWFMAQNRTFAIFQDLSALDIIKKVFEAAGASDVDYSRLTRSYAPRSYCVQYRESDFAFISRLMEEEGIYYYVRHTAESHTLVLCDGPSSHQAGTPATLHFNPNLVGLRISGQVRTDRRSYLQKLSERVSSGAEAKVTLRDFDFEHPGRPLEAEWVEPGAHPGDREEIYDYPGRYVDEHRGVALGKTMLNALRRDRQLYTGESHSIALACGARVSIADHPNDRFNAAYLVTRVHHSITVQTRSGPEDQHDPFNVHFEAIPAATAFQSPRRTPRPQVQGLETAIISGPAGETIYTDKYGRVKVRFHWDRSGSAGDKSTCWVRVAQFGNLGSLILPRVGQEVMVDFLQGDPDQPIVCGWVFNATHMPVYDLPENKTRALWRTKRYGDTGKYPQTEDLDTGKPGVNELRFEDKGGHEEVFLHAERDMNTRIRFDETHHVGHVQDVKVGYDRTDKVGHDETTSIGNNQDLTVTGNQTEKIKAKRDIDVSATDKLHVGQSIKIDAGTTIEISANQSIKLTVGGSSITIDQKGVKIEGMMLENAAQIQSKTTGLFCNVEASAFSIVKGALVLIN